MPSAGRLPGCGVARAIRCLRPTRQRDAPGPSWSRRRGASSRIRAWCGIAARRRHARMAEIAAGLSEELIIALSRFRWLGCVPCGAWQKNPRGLHPGWRGATLRRSAARVAAPDVPAGGRRDGLGGALRSHYHRHLRPAGSAGEQHSARLDHGCGSMGGRTDRRGGPERGLPRTSCGWRCRRSIAWIITVSWLRAAARKFIALDRQRIGNAWAAQWHVFAVGQGWASAVDAADRARSELGAARDGVDPEDARG